MKWVGMLLFLTMLCGCGAQPVWERVEDELPAAVNFYEMNLDLPSDAVLLEEQADCKLYQSGDLEITTSSFSAQNLQDAVKQLSGFEPQNLNILQTTSGGMEEYQFAWYAETAEGGRIFRADLIMDETRCYAVVCSGPESAGNFHEQSRQVIAAFSLQKADPV